MSTNNKTGAVATSSGAPTIINILPRSEMVQIQVDDGGNHSLFRLAINGEAVDTTKNSVAFANGMPVLIDGPVDKVTLYAESGATGQSYAIADVRRPNEVG